MPVFQAYNTQKTLLQKSHFMQSLDALMGVILFCKPFRKKDQNCFCTMKNHRKHVVPGGFGFLFISLPSVLPELLSGRADGFLLHRKFHQRVLRILPL